MEIPIRGLKLAHSLGQPCTTFVSAHPVGLQRRSAGSSSTRNLKFTRLTHNLGQLFYRPLQGSSVDLLQGRPCCEFYLRSGRVARCGADEELDGRLPVVQPHWSEEGVRR